MVVQIYMHHSYIHSFVHSCRLRTSLGLDFFLNGFVLVGRRDDTGKGMILGRGSQHAGTACHKTKDKQIRRDLHESTCSDDKTNDGCHG